MPAPTETEIRAAVERAWTRERPDDKGSPGNEFGLSIKDQVVELISLLQSDVTDLWEVMESEPATAAYLRLSAMVGSRVDDLVQAIASSTAEWSELYPNMPRPGETDQRWQPAPQAVAS